MMCQKHHGKSALAVTLAELQAALAEGWVMDASEGHKQIPDRPTGDWYCDLILWRDDRVRVMTLPEDAALRRFLAERNLMPTDQGEGWSTESLVDK